MENVYDSLWIGDAWDVQQETSPVEFDRVISVCFNTYEDNVACDVYNRYPMLDEAPDNATYAIDDELEARAERNDSSIKEAMWLYFAEAADAVLDALNAGETVLIHCNAGMSRSVMVATAVIATVESESFDAAHSRIKEKRNTSPSDIMREFAHKYINRN